MLRKTASLAAAALLLAGLATPSMADNAPGVTATEIKVGAVFPFSGPASALGAVGKSLIAYVISVNDRGGVNGRKVKLVTIDDKFDPELAKANARTLIERQHVFALFQGRGTPHTEAILPLLAQYRVPLIAPGSGADPIPSNPFSVCRMISKSSGR